MTQLIQIGQTLLFLLVPAALYFLGRIKPIGRFYGVLFTVLGSMFQGLAVLLTPFAIAQRRANRYPGLRTILLFVAAAFAIVATGADWFLTNQALPAFTDDTSLTFTLPPSLSWLNLSQGFLLLSIPSIAGMILLDTYFHIVPVEARIFTVPTDDKTKRKFDKYILITFWLSLVASIAFNALKPSYMLDTESWVTWVLRIAEFIALGGLLPLCMALTIYLISLAVHSLISLGLTIAWFLAALFAHICKFFVQEFTDTDQSQDLDTGGSVIVEADNPPPELPTKDSNVVDPPKQEDTPKRKRNMRRRKLSLKWESIPVPAEQNSEQE